MERRSGALCVWGAGMEASQGEASQKEDGAEAGRMLRCVWLRLYPRRRTCGAQAARGGVAQRQAWCTGSVAQQVAYRVRVRGRVSTERGRGSRQ